MGKLPKERIPVVKKEEQRVMLQSFFLKTPQEALNQTNTIQKKEEPRVIHQSFFLKTQQEVLKYVS